MAEATHVLALDQGTTSTRAILFDRAGRPAGRAQVELPQHFPGEGRVEHDPEDIWQATVAVLRGALADAKVPAERVAALGITNQRETTVLWERDGGRPVHRALVWQDRRTADWCARMRRELDEADLHRRTGLLLDPYFSASKLFWLLEEIPGARRAATAGRLAFGTVDSFLLWRLTGGRRHATDASNASRTLLFDIRRQEWDGELLERFGIPAAVLPEVLDSTADFGTTDPGILGVPVPVTGIAGDQQAATFGQACFTPGAMKSTYGTGCFAVVNTGERCLESRHRLLATVAWRLEGRPTYALEGSIFAAGSTVQWLRDGLGILSDAAASETLARQADPEQQVVLVPAFTGLGAPHWDPHARGAVLGLTRASGPAELARAALEAVGHQTRELLDAMAGDGAARPPALRVDGGLTANAWAMQYLADVLDLPVERPRVPETTALGAAFLAGLRVGFWRSLEEIAGLWRADARFEPAMDAAERAWRHGRWLRAVAAVRTLAAADQG